MKSLESFIFLDETKDKETLEGFERKDETDTFSKKGKTQNAVYYLISAEYDGQRRAARLKLYDPISDKIEVWYDNTDHHPYCLAPWPLSDSDRKNVEKHSGFKNFEKVTKYDPLFDREVDLTKIVAKDPRSIGGSSSENENIRGKVPKSWEARIKYYNCYIYDRQIQMGMPYKLLNDHLIPVKYQSLEEDRQRLKALVKKEDPEYKEYIFKWFQLLESPIPGFRRVALDIEVYSPVSNRVPDPNEAEEKVIAASLVNSDGQKKVLILKREELDEEQGPAPAGLDVVFYDQEEKMIREIFKILSEFPIVVTYNGDEFDLRYLYNRAKNLKIPQDQIPIHITHRYSSLNYGIHIDLYRFFFNRSIWIYAFSKKYTNNTLDNVAQSLIGKGKIELTAPISELDYSELIKYTIRDAEITFQLTSFDDELVMKLILALSRISKLPLEDVTRQGVSRWIQNLMFAEHRRLNWLIPRSEDLSELKGTSSTESVIDGKKYRGAIVVDPKPGTHFNISVLDFASLYPSIIKQWNLSYETVRCPHDECKKQTIPGTSHWVCKRNKGISSLLIGSLRDLRVKWYKPRSKNTNLSSSKRSWYNVIQQSLKVILNASYGVFGSSVFSLYCLPVAESTAAVGRYAITKTIDKANSLGIEVLYGDTDSIFIKSSTKQQINELSKWSANSLGMELEVDKVYRYVMFSLRKKNYLGVYSDGRVDVKGLTGKKRHTPPFLKKTFQEVVDTLGEVMSQDEVEIAKRKIKNIVYSSYIKLKKREYLLEELAFKIMMNKPIEHYRKTTPQHVKAAMQLKEAGNEVKSGELISFIKVNNSDGVKPLQLASVEEADLKKYVSYMKATLEQILNVIGIEFDEILGLTKLETFLWNDEQ